MINNTAHTASFFGFKFNGFSVSHHKNILFCIFITGGVSFLLTNFFLFWNTKTYVFSVLGEFDLYNTSESFSYVLYVFSIIFLAYFVSSLIYGYLFNKLIVILFGINANHLLNCFDLNNAYLKRLAKDDIEKNGYLSAYGYLQLNKKNKSIKEKNEHNEHIKNRKDALKKEFPNVFNED